MQKVKIMNNKDIQNATTNYLKRNNYPHFDLKTVMFDMDGVLFDSMKNHARSWHDTMAHFGLNLPYEEAFMHEGRTAASTINIVSLRERGHEATEDEIKEIYAYKGMLFNQCPEAVRMPGAYQLLLNVKSSGLTPMVVTGSGQKSLLERLQTNFPGIFQKDLMVTAFDVRQGKPNPEPYLMGMRKAGNLQPNQSIVVENAPLGVQSAVASGCFTIAVNTGPLPDSALLDEGADILFPSMQALCDQWSSLFAILSTTP